MGSPGTDARSAYVMELPDGGMMLIVQKSGQACMGRSITIPEARDLIHELEAHVERIKGKVPKI